jgi:hypothetical protein
MGRLVGAEAQLAAALRLFVITRDPLDWLAGRGSAWATSNADGDALELPVYVARDEVQRRVEANEGDLVAALGRLGETAVIAAARCQGIIFAGAIQRARTSNPAGWPQSARARRASAAFPSRPATPCHSVAARPQAATGPVRAAAVASTSTAADSDACGGRVGLWLSGQDLCWGFRSLRARKSVPRLPSPSAGAAIIARSQ